MTQRHAEILVIGSGPAGYTAAIYAARAMMKPLLVAGLQEGGQLTITSDVENYPGYRDPIGGPFLMEEMKQQALNVGAEMAADLIVEADLSRRPFTFKGDSGTVYTADAVIIATGAQARWLGSSRKPPSRASASRPAPPATGSSIAARTWSWSAAATRPSRRRSISPTSRAPSRWSTAARASAPSASCRTGSSPRRTSRSSGTPRSPRCWGP